MTTEEENAQELRLIANGVPALLSYIDGDARYVWCNEGYNQSFGYTTEQVRVKDGDTYEGRDANGCVRGVVVLVNDVTDRKAAERALRKSEQMLERSQSAAHVGSWDVDLAGAAESRAGSVKWSAETFGILGYEPDALEPSGAAFFDRIHPDAARGRPRSGGAGGRHRVWPG